MHIHVERPLRIKRRLNEILADRTGQPLEVIEADVERDKFMTAEEAKADGIVEPLWSGILQASNEVKL